MRRLLALVAIATVATVPARAATKTTRPTASLARYLVSLEEMPDGWGTNGPDSVGSLGEALCPKIKVAGSKDLLMRTMSDNDQLGALFANVARFSDTASAAAMVRAWRQGAAGCKPDFDEKSMTTLGNLKLAKLGDESLAFRARYTDPAGNSCTVRIVIVRADRNVGLLAAIDIGSPRIDMPTLAAAMAKRLAAK